MYLDQTESCSALATNIGHCLFSRTELTMPMPLSQAEGSSTLESSIMHPLVERIDSASQEEESDVYGEAKL